MGLSDWLDAWCCCCCRGRCLGDAALSEKEPLVSNNLYTSFGATQAWDEEKNLWSAPHDISHTEADDDRILYNLIVVRERLDKDSEVKLIHRGRSHAPNMPGEETLLRSIYKRCSEIGLSVAEENEQQMKSLQKCKIVGEPSSLYKRKQWWNVCSASTDCCESAIKHFTAVQAAGVPVPESSCMHWWIDRDSEEWQKLNYDIYTLRQMRREVRNRWKGILEDLGFQKEADTLLSVTKRSIVSDSQNMSKAYDILLKLSEETTIFPTSWELSERYLFVVDRLIALDAAEEFLRIASVTYPKRICALKNEDNLKMVQCNSSLS